MTAPDVDQPLPGMPDPEPLWALHVQGSDDILAMLDLQAATTAKALHDALDKRIRAEGDPLRPLANARIIPWPYGAEAHARQLAGREAGQ